MPAESEGEEIQYYKTPMPKFPFSLHMVLQNIYLYFRLLYILYPLYTLWRMNETNRLFKPLAHLLRGSYPRALLVLARECLLEKVFSFVSNVGVKLVL